MSLGHIAGRVDLVVHSKHLAFRLRINADAHRIQEITGPVKIGFRSIALRTDQDNRFLGIGREVEPIRCLLKRVGSMRNYNASYFRSGECTVDFAG
jgi:hypothetical protein